MTLEFGPFRAEADLKATQGWYAQAEEWGCDCGDCRNFLKLARERALPAPVLEMLDTLGVPPEKATYVCEMGPAEGGRLYQFNYRLAGRILSGDGLYSVALDGFNAWCYHEPDPCADPGFPEPHFDLGFFAVLPWVLNQARE